MNNLFLAIYDGTGTIKNGDLNFGQACLISLFAICLVFLILALIILIISLVSIPFKKALANVNNNVNITKEEVSENKKVEITDDDMMVACLVATIDYRNEVKTDVKVKSVKRIG